MTLSEMQLEVIVRAAAWTEEEVKAILAAVLKEEAERTGRTSADDEAEAILDVLLLELTLRKPGSTWTDDEISRVWEHVCGDLLDDLVRLAYSILHRFLPLADPAKLLVEGEDVAEDKNVDAWRRRHTYDPTRYWSTIPRRWTPDAGRFATGFG